MLPFLAHAEVSLLLFLAMLVKLKVAVICVQKLQINLSLKCRYTFSLLHGSAVG